VVGYKKIKFHTHDNVGYGDVRLPDMQMHTAGVWLTVLDEIVDGVAHAQGVSRPAVIEALRGMSRALHTVASVGLMIDPRDLGRTLGGRDEPEGPPAKEGGQIFNPTIFLYDQVPGGVGLSSRLFDQREELVRRARKLVDGCACEDGCPTCIGPAVGVDAPGMPGAAMPVVRGRKALCLELFTALGFGAVQ